MSNFTKWLLRRLIRSVVHQGSQWVQTIELMEIIREEWQAEYAEENRFTHRNDLKEIFEASEKSYKSI